MLSLVFLGMDLGLPAGLSSLVLQIQVVFTLLLSGILLHDPPSRWQKIGVAVALGGIGLLAVDMHDGATFPGLVLVVAAGFVWGISNMLLKLSRSVDMFRLIIWMSIVPPLPLLLISLIFEEGQAEAIAGVSWTGAGAILYTGLISTVLGFGLWGKLFKQYSPNTIAPFALLVPVSGIISSALVLGERFTVIELLSLCIVFAGLFMVIMEARLSSMPTPKWKRIRKRVA